jgi:hypothetical protein
MSIYKSIKPTYLYIKQHSVTGLKYFGKTTKTDPYKYSGSGGYWKNHIKKHGKKFVNTIWVSDLYYDTSIVEHALHFSIENNIVESNNWANLKLENGLDGGSVICLEETKAKISIKIKGLTRTTEQSEKQSIRQKGRKQSHKHNMSIGKAHTKKFFSIIESRKTYNKCWLTRNFPEFKEFY